MPNSSLGTRPTETARAAPEASNPTPSIDTTDGAPQGAAGEDEGKDAAGRGSAPETVPGAGAEEEEDDDDEDEDDDEMQEAKEASSDDDEDVDGCATVLKMCIFF